MKWFYNLSKNVRIIITVLAWLIAIGLIGGTQNAGAAVVGVIILVAAIVFTVWTVKAGKQEKGTSSAEQKTDKAESAAVRVDTSKIEKDFFSKVVGVTFNNEDGSSRQKYISGLKAGDELTFRPVAIEGHPEAVGVFTTDGKQLGHLTAELAGELRNKYPTHPISATVAQVTGGGDRSYGCNIHIIIYELPNNKNE